MPLPQGLGARSCLRGAHDSGWQPWVDTVPRSLGLGVGLGAPVLGKDPLREAQTLLASRVPGRGPSTLRAPLPASSTGP